MTTAENTATGVLLTEAAAAKAKALLDQEGRDDLSLRIAVQPGGCAGLRYQLFFDDRSLDGDVVDDFLDFCGIDIEVPKDDPDRQSNLSLTPGGIDHSAKYSADCFPVSMAASACSRSRIITLLPSSPAVLQLLSSGDHWAICDGLKASK